MFFVYFICIFFFFFFFFSSRRRHTRSLCDWSSDVCSSDLKLEGGAMTLKTEKKAPLMHVSIGKTSVETKKLVENIEALMKSLSSQIIGLKIGRASCRERV